MNEDDKTRIIRRPEAPPLPGQDDDRTRKMEPSTPAYGATPPVREHRPADDDRTVILGPTTRRRSAEPAPAEATDTPQDHMQDPVVGWLAIVGGPGAGGFVRMGYGFNSIGRAADQRCRLDFGDEKISRQNHASITYDPRGRKFYLQHGGGQNLTYLGEMPVLAPTELKGGEFIVLGHTVLRFVPLCGEDFDYPDVPEPS